MENAANRWAVAPYSGVAQIYDDLMADIFEKRQAPLIEDTLCHLRLTPGTWADIAGGTGTVACFLARKGWRVFASDVSEEMLEVARAKIREQGASVQTQKQDMRDFQPPEPCDVASCFFDSLNILTRRTNLLRMFQQVAQGLKPGGYFLFDVVTPWQTRHLFDYCDQIHEGKGYFGIWEKKKDATPDVASVQMRWFIRQDNGLFARIDETHRIRGYARSEIVEMLRAAGLKLIASYEGDSGFLSKLSAKTMRIDYIARKPG
ncbi:MAG: class I SAM-dependent methyltransferase [Candidatus Sumerlaeota bacterium]|nr:class I SAM-dependent methyltransferase [Candidatus Sumerlaeota bacterium]